MTDDEYNAIKEAEKERLRLKQTADALRQSLRRSASTEGMLQAMQRKAKGLLDETTSLTKRVLRDVARGAARLETTLETPDAGDDPDAAYREMSADARLRRMKQELSTSRSSTPDPDAPSDRSAADTGNAAAREGAEGASSPDDGLPDKTIGRYR
jgi:hypothetical protein